jgi:hypothetical protein
LLQEKKSEKKNHFSKKKMATRQCEECKLDFPKNWVSQTTCCQKFKCGQTCAGPCDPEDCTSWICHLKLTSSCFGICPKEPKPVFSDWFNRDLFQDETDHDDQRKIAMMAYRMGKDLNCVQQLLISEVLDISDIYPELLGAEIRNPFDLQEQLKEQLKAEKLISQNLREELDQVKSKLFDVQNDLDEVQSKLKDMRCENCNQESFSLMCTKCVYDQ